MPSNHLILCHPLLSLCSIFRSIRLFSNESALCIRCSKYWNFNFTPCLSNEYSQLISFRMDWLDLLAVQGTLKSLLQHHSSKASMLSLLYGPTLIFIHDYWKNHSFDYTELCQQSDVSLSRFVIAILPRSRSFSFVTAVTICVDFGAQENEIWHYFHFCPIYLPWSDRTGCHDLLFFECWVLSKLFHSPLSPTSRGPLVPLHFLPLKCYHLHIWGCWYFSQKSWFQVVIHPA